MVQGEIRDVEREAFICFGDWLERPGTGWWWPGTLLKTRSFLRKCAQNCDIAVDSCPQSCPRIDPPEFTPRVSAL